MKIDELDVDVQELVGFHSSNVRKPTTNDPGPSAFHARARRAEGSLRSGGLAQKPGLFFWKTSTKACRGPRGGPVFF